MSNDTLNLHICAGSHHNEGTVSYPKLTNVGANMSANNASLSQGALRQFAADGTFSYRESKVIAIHCP